MPSSKSFQFMEDNMYESYKYYKSPIEQYHQSNNIAALNYSITNTILPKGWHYVAQEKITENNNLQIHKQENNRILRR